MRVRIAYTVEVDADARRAIRLHYGQPGLATRGEVRDWYRVHGSSGDDDLMWDLNIAEQAAAASSGEGEDEEVGDDEEA